MNLKHSLALIIFLVFEAQAQDKWNYIPPEPYDASRTSKMYTGNWDIEKDKLFEREDTKKLKGKHSNEPELPFGEHFQTFYKEKRNSITNEIESIEQGMDF